MKNRAMSKAQLLPVYLFTFCYNEKAVLAQAIAYYQHQFPGLHITVFDNHSTDGSPEIAREMGCKVVTYGPTDEMDNKMMMDTKNNIWKEVPEPAWIIVIDIDEWICLDQRDLLREQLLGTTVFRFQGYEMTADHKHRYLEGLNIAEDVNEGYAHDPYSKMAIFRGDQLTETQYGPGAHGATPTGTVQYSKEIYRLYHYKFLGTNYVVGNYKRNFNRTHTDRTRGMSIHYTTDGEAVLMTYVDNRLLSKPIEPISHFMQTAGARAK